MSEYTLFGFPIVEMDEMEECTIVLADFGAWACGEEPVTVWVEQSDKPEPPETDG